MSQHDYIISNDTGANVRSDLNNALGAIASVNSGATEPSTTYAYQLWMDTTNNVLKIRNSANSAWYTLPISPVANNTVDINGGTIDGATIGGSSAGAGTFTNLTATGTSSLNGAVVINESGADVDFRIESDTNANALFLEGSSGNVGIGTSSPASLLDISQFGGTPTIRITNSDGTFSAGQDIGKFEFFCNDQSTPGARVASYILSQAAGVNGGGDLQFATCENTGTVTERMRIDSSGNLLVGQTTASTSATGTIITPSGKSYHIATSDFALALDRKSTDGTILEFRKDQTVVGSIGVYGGDLYIGALGNIGVSLFDAANCFVPTTKTGSALDNVMDLGRSTHRWDDVYATNGTIQTSDRNEKQDIEELSEAEQRVAVAAKGLLRKYRWKDSVAEKGDEARIHFGIIAQDLQAAFEAEGLDAGRYAMFIHSTWWETYTDVPAVEAVDAVYETQTDEEGNEVQVLVSEAVEAKEAYTRTDTHDEPVEGATEKSRMGIRYPELLAFIIAAI